MAYALKVGKRARIDQSGKTLLQLGRELFGILTSPVVMTVRTFLFITALTLCHPQLRSQTLTRQFPSAAQSADASAAPADPLPDMPNSADYPVAEVVIPPPTGIPVSIQADQQEKHGSIYTLTGSVRIDYKNYVLTADTVSYNADTSDAEADGHVQLQGGRDNELILADHGKLNFDLETGRFDNVTGSIGRQPSANKRKLVYTTANPFLFTGRWLIKEGPERYQIVRGTMTSCLLPDPDWLIHSSLIHVAYGQARAENSYFTLLHVPILYLPFVTHPVSTEARQSGLLIPIVGTSSTKGTIFGDSIYLVINRSMDATIGTQYYSKRGWAPTGDFRYRGRGEDFASAPFYCAV